MRTINAAAEDCVKYLKILVYNKSSDIRQTRLDKILLKDFSYSGRQKKWWVNIKQQMEAVKLFYTAPNAAAF